MRSFGLESKHGMAGWACWPCTLNFSTRRVSHFEGETLFGIELLAEKLMVVKNEKFERKIYFCTSDVLQNNFLYVNIITVNVAIIDPIYDLPIAKIRERKISHFFCNGKKWSKSVVDCTLFALPFLASLPANKIMKMLKRSRSPCIMHAREQKRAFAKSTLVPFKNLKISRVLKRNNFPFENSKNVGPRFMGPIGKLPR